MSIETFSSYKYTDKLHKILDKYKKDKYNSINELNEDLYKILVTNIILHKRDNKKIKQKSYFLPRYLLKNFVNKNLKNIIVKEPRFSDEELLNHWEKIQYDPTLETLKEISTFCGKKIIDQKYKYPFDLSEITYDNMIQNKGNVNNKFSGNDGISMEILYNYYPIHQELQSFYNDIFKLGHVPNQWNKGCNILKYKKGNVTEPKNFRPITLLPHIAKWYNRILKYRIREYCEKNKIINKNIQQGAMPGLNGVFTLNKRIELIREHAIKHNKKLYIIFLDLKNAYGSINHNMIEFVLKYYNFPSNVVKYLMNYYNNQDACFKLKEGITKYINWNIGVFQGCSLSDLIFILTINFVINCIFEKYYEYGYCYGDKKILMNAYVDDMCLFGENKRCVQTTLNYLVKSFKKAGCSFSIEKCKVLCINDNCDFSIDNIKIGQIGNEQFKYLGKFINFNKRLEIKYMKNILNELLKSLLNYEKFYYENIKEIKIPKRKKTKKTIHFKRNNNIKKHNLRVNKMIKERKLLTQKAINYDINYLYKNNIIPKIRFMYSLYSNNIKDEIIELVLRYINIDKNKLRKILDNVDKSNKIKMILYGKEDDVISSLVNINEIENEIDKNEIESYLMNLENSHISNCEY